MMTTEIIRFPAPGASASPQFKPTPKAATVRPLGQELLG
jgi:hypothetical protein